MIVALGRTPAVRLHCATDDWDFDPRYTGGACPICGWRPEPVVARELPEWQRRLAAIPWDLVALGMLLVILVGVGVYVANAAKLNLLPS